MILKTRDQSRVSLLTFVLLLSFIFSAGANSFAQQKVNVDISEEHQIMDGVGGNIYGFITSSNWSSNVLSLILNDIDVTHLRIRSWINQWEPNNDNSDPESINWSAFKDHKLVHDDFVLMREIRKAGIEVILGIWEVPSWMVLNPNATEDRIIPPHMYPEFAG